MSKLSHRRGSLHSFFGPVDATAQAGRQIPSRKRIPVVDQYGRGAMKVETFGILRGINSLMDDLNVGATEVGRGPEEPLFCLRPVRATFEELDGDFHVTIFCMPPRPWIPSLFLV